MGIFDIYFLEAVINGILLAGVLGLLALGCNLFFGVIDVVWICYAELVMAGMYCVWWLYVQHGVPLPIAWLLAILLVAAMGVLVHVGIIARLLDTAPINQLLATGGLLFFLQSFITMLFGVDFRNLGLRMPLLEIGGMFISVARLIAFSIALLTVAALYVFLKRTFLGRAIRAVSQDREIMALMGVDIRRVYIVTSFIGGGLAGLAGCVLLLQYDVHPALGGTFGPLTFMICVLGGLGNMVGGFFAALVISQIIAIGGLLAHVEWGICRGLRVLHCDADLEAAGHYGATYVNNAWKALILAGLLGLTALKIPPYVNHLLIIILLWSFAYTSWSIMGRFGLVSIGHGAFLGIGAYGTALLWNYGHVTPWIGIPAALVLAAGLAALVGYPCFRFRVVGHYFALVTLALGEVVRLSIVAMRDYTGGSLGMTPRRAAEGDALFALFVDKRWFYLIALLTWVGGLYVWRRIDNGMSRYAMDVISEDETAAAAIGINVMREKMKITMLSAVMVAFAGALFAQYQLYINPETVSGINISLQIVFAAVVGGMFTMMGPTVGAIFTIMLAELLRVGIGVTMVGLDNTIYGALLIAFIIFLPNGIVGTAQDWFKRKQTQF